MAEFQNTDGKEPDGWFSIGQTYLPME